MKDDMVVPPTKSLCFTRHFTFVFIKEVKYAFLVLRKNEKALPKM